MGHLLPQEGKKVRTGGGFGGRGFKFDENEAQNPSDRKRFEKAALGKSEIAAAGRGEDQPDYLDRVMLYVLCRVFCALLFCPGLGVTLLSLVKKYFGIPLGQSIIYDGSAVLCDS